MTEKHSLKFTDIIDVEDLEINTPTGYQPLKRFYKTVPYTIYHVILSDGKELYCADRHKLIDSEGNEIFAEELQVGDLIDTIDGVSPVKQIINTNQQEECFDVEIDDDNHLYYTNGITSHNTTTASAYILHQIITRKDITVAILANKEETAKEILERIKFGFSMLPWYMKPGVLEWNKKSFHIASGQQGNKIFASATSPDSIRGRSVSLLLVDEMSSIKGANEFYESTFPVISASRTSQFITISTPKGLNLFYKLWKDAQEGKNTFKPFFSPWWENPTRDENWAEEQRKNMGDEQRYRQEVLCDFIGSSLTLISGDTLSNLTAKHPIEEDEYSKVYEKPQPNHRYVAVVDVSEGLSQDYSVVNVIDVSETPYKQVCIFRHNLTQPEELSHIAYTIASTYNNAFITVENNGIGKIVGDALYYDYEYDNILTSVSRNGETELQEGITRLNVGLRQTTKSKKIGCAKLKSLVESETLIINDAVTIDELMTFVKDGQTYKAETGMHDDTSMTLVMFGWLTSTANFKSLTGFANDDRESLKERNSVPLTLFSYSNGINNDTWNGMDNGRFFMDSGLSEEEYKIWDGIFRVNATD